MSAALLAGATFFLLPLRHARFNIARLVISSACLAMLLPLEVRAASVAALALLGVFAVQRRWATLVSLVALPLAAYALVAVVGLEFIGRSGSTRPEDIVSRQLSTIPVLVGGNVAEATAAGDVYTSDAVVDTIAWRLVWWSALMGELTSSSLKSTFGLGFGADLTEPLGYQPGDPNVPPVRSPHNFLLTVFARMGLVGLAAWIALLAAWADVLLRATREAMQRHQHADADYLLWLMAYPLALIVSAVFGVVLEGPYGAIPCYLLLGLGLAASADTRARQLRASAEASVHTATAAGSRPALASSPAIHV
jgi:hypothetical protein